MTTIRRIYAYLLAFAGLAMVSLAAAHLAQLLIDVALQSPPATAGGYVRDTVSLWGALALVGLPVWLLHWLWVQRSTRADADEMTSPLRRLYLYAVLAGAILAAGYSIQEMLVQIFDALGFRTTGGVQTLDAILRPLPFAVVATLVWIAHWRTAAADRYDAGEVGGSARLRRWYLYGSAFVGLLLLLNGARALIEALWLTATQVATAQGVGIPRAAADALVGLGVWVLHWVVLPRRLPAVARHDDGVSVLRSVYLFLALAVGVIGTLLGLSELLYYTVGRALGIASPGGVGGDLVQAAAGPASAAIVYGAAWAYQRAALRRQAAAFDEAPRQAGIRRLYTHVVALVALSVLTSGVAGLLWTLCDVLVAPGASIGDYWRERVALYATLAMVGLPVWFLHWRPVVASVDESRSLARRLYVYLTLIAAMLTVVGSVAALLYRLLGIALGGGWRPEVVADLTHAVAVASVASVVAAYHWQVLRADARRTGTVPVEARDMAALVEASDLAEAPERSSTVLVEIQADTEETLSRALSSLRATGVTVTVRRHDWVGGSRGIPRG